MFRIEHPQLLYLLLIVPFLIFIQWYVSYRRKKTIKSLGDVQLIEQLTSETSLVKRKIKFILLILAIISLIIGLANPQIGSKLEKIHRKGAEIIIALDVSNSMLTEDIKPNRLERAKQSISKLIEKMQGDRIGIIVFAGKAYTQLPITIDYGAAKMFLNNITTDLVPTQGTAIGSAIELAMNTLSSDDKKNKAIIIITDGENHEDDALEAAKKAAQKNIVIHTIGMGLAEGGPIPIYKKNTLTGFKKDKDGNTVISKLDELLLQQIASIGNGTYTRASNSDVGLNNVYKEISKLEKVEFETKQYAEFENQFWYFMLATLILLVLEAFINERKGKLFRNFSLFSSDSQIIKKILP